MRISRLVMAACAGLSLAGCSGNAPSHDSARLGFERQEQGRLQAHFDSVTIELRTASVDHLSRSEREARSALIAWLHEYRDAGRFPRNDRFGPDMPFFRDEQGTLCAMAYLVARSGRPGMVDRIARTANNALIPDLRDDGEFTQWLDSTGLTLAEAARVQPEYRSEGDLTFKHVLHRRW
ncbi:MAG: hypothetical protein H7066_15760 [Cytophagaceae bacterium]|nr:hypothetical protein [Gemmatimonadaceae bacterium]